MCPPTQAALHRLGRTSSHDPVPRGPKQAGPAQCSPPVGVSSVPGAFVCAPVAAAGSRRRLAGSSGKCGACGTPCAHRSSGVKRGCCPKASAAIKACAAAALPDAAQADQLEAHLWMSSMLSWSKPSCRASCCPSFCHVPRSCCTCAGVMHAAARRGPLQI